jgi:glycosyltransferase involved in cell wall biosynthesis
MTAICLSSYNGALFLSQQLRSLESQTYDLSQLTLIVRDDGSSDECYELLEQFAGESSIRIELLNDQTNLGVKKSFELLINVALQNGAEYIMFCDQDDVWQSDKVSKTMTMMQQMEISSHHQPILIHSNLSVVDRDLAILHNSFWTYQNIDPTQMNLHQLIVKNNITGCTMMINRTLAEKIRNIPQEAIMHDWWIAMVASAFGQIGYLDESLILYRQHSTNDTGAKQYGWRYWLSRFMKKQSLEKYILQTRAFLECYRDQLNPTHIEMLEAVSRLDKMNWFERRKTLIKYKIFKNGFVRNIGLMVFA